MQRSRTARRRACRRPTGELLSARELYVCELTGNAPALWRVGLDDGSCAPLAAAGAPAGENEQALLAWAASALLARALGRRAAQAAVKALAQDIAGFAGRVLTLEDVDVRLWYLRFRLLAGVDAARR